MFQGSSLFLVSIWHPFAVWLAARRTLSFVVSLVFLKGAFLVPGLEDGEEDAAFDVMLAAMCGFAPWCRTLVWLALSCFQDFFAPRLAGTAEYSVGKKCYQVGFYEGQRKGCGRHKVTDSSKAFLLLSFPQVILSAWCVAAALTGIFVVLSVQAANAGILSSKFLCCAVAALNVSIALLVLYCDCTWTVTGCGSLALVAGYGIRLAAASVYIHVCAAARIACGSRMARSASGHHHI